MAFWWVNQGRTYQAERQGGYLWAPKRNKSGRELHHWSTMTRVRPGDVIFSYVRKQIVAVSIAKTGATDSHRPEELGRQDKWRLQGWQVRIAYRDLSNPLPISPILDHLQQQLPEKYSPLKPSGTGNEGYLYALPPSAGRYLLRQIGSSEQIADDMIIEASVKDSASQSTERRALIQSRIGQGEFRTKLLRRWGGRCCVTSLSVEELLRASHIKPWKDSSNAERLDPFNGLLLGPAHDAAFDKGLITFQHDGAIIISKTVDPSQLELLGISAVAQINNLEQDHAKYLEYHRQYVYR